MRKVKVGLIGFGTVGSGVVKILQERKTLLARKAGVEIELAAVADKDLRSRRSVRLDRRLLTGNVEAVIGDPAISIIVELIGGVHPAKEIIIRALAAGKHVVTANKHLLAAEKEELFARARKHGRMIAFEASVGGGIPIIKALKEGLISNRLKTLFGIVNGTSNFILSRMTEQGWEFRRALAEAQRLGYAERNPFLDVSGLDSAHKLSILASLGFGRNVRLGDIYVEGIERITQGDILYADDFGYRIKLLAIAKREGNMLEVRVHPTLIPKGHALSRISGADNAIYVDGDLVGEQVYKGRGAGQLPTASAVVSDIIDLARFSGREKTDAAFSLTENWDGGRIKRIKKINETTLRYYIRFSAVDRPGVLAKISRVLGQYQISIASVIQKERKKARVVPIVLMTHLAREEGIKLALKKIDRLEVVHDRSLAIRLEED